MTHEITNETDRPDMTIVEIDITDLDSRGAERFDPDGAAAVSVLGWADRDLHVHYNPERGHIIARVLATAQPAVQGDRVGRVTLGVWEAA